MNLPTFAFLWLAIITLIASLSGCAGGPLAQYDRTYSLQYIGADGQQIGTSIRLSPPKSGLAK